MTHPSDTMNAMVLTGHGDMDKLVFHEVADARSRSPRAKC